MACRLGITTDPETRRRHWQGERPGLRNWQILHTANSKTRALQLENEEASRRACQASPGGAGEENATWHVYYFKY